MGRKLVLPANFQDYAWEVEAKGVFEDAVVLVDGATVPVTFYDPVRLSQDVAGELAESPIFLLRRALVVESLTEEHMRDAVERAPLAFFR